MAGEWITEKARGLMHVFPGQWDEVTAGIFQGRCPGEHLHHGSSAATDCRVHISYGAGGESPGIYCLHNSCKGVLEPLNKSFRDGIFAKDPDWKPSHDPNAGVSRAPRAKEAWIPDYDEEKLKAVVHAVPELSENWFMERSPVDVRHLTPGEFIEHAFMPGERVLVFTDFKSQGDFLWLVGKGGYRLAAQREVQAVRSKLPVDGGKDGIWYLCNPVDAQWHANPRRAGAYSRRSMESVTAWRHMVLESDSAPSALWLRFLSMAPFSIVAIYSSGGRSWHALVRVNMPTKADFDTLLRMTVKRTLPLLGADPGAMTPVRLTRLPGCTRGGKMQKLIYLNPKAQDMPIRDMSIVRKVQEHS